MGLYVCSLIRFSEASDGSGGVSVKDKTMAEKFQLHQRRKVTVCRL